MKPKVTEAHRRPRNLQEGGPNWILVAGGALLSTLSIRLGYKLKQFLDNRQTATRSQSLIGSRNVVEVKQNSDGQTEMSLPLVTVPTSVFNEESGVMWSSSPDRLELPQKPFHQSNSSDSPCVSESGSIIFSKREVIQKLRQQLKRRDDMILEMQDQIAELQNSHSVQLSHSSHLQSLLDAANGDLFDSEREIQRLRKAIADHCVGHIISGEKSPNVPTWPVEWKNGHTNGFQEIERNSECSEKARGDGGRIELLKREVSELKELIEGKDYLLQSYKEQKSELSMKIKELQQRLDSQLPNIL
ncbi:uncharacterized protein [Henckelia pumila]|uniref:uncharacterized protein isoform X2 n=1 Tax=Henckelia pumila TaxID=405737 RepID=UPI003C6DEFC4